ncbi:acyl-CoA thioester hydrolase YciA [Gallibacterium salpingitidis]|uniref:Acyl-CoA thioester hydrolase n=1 Tax=Gallibacterium salpingitidis TaxID=505341 RepID=A0A1A7NTL5_9PAST|nr:acyl-CoA thioester hydrolase YciA [Gallibacterium salpingitidis]OBW92841.1 acyl-CoA thioester hydrolase [Gallibacterium salpingitidis]
MDTTARTPDGTLLLRTLAMPSDTNANGDIFGGWIMSQMDIGGAILAKEIAHRRVVTVHVNNMTFHKPVSVGDVVCCYGRCTRVGNTSIQVQVEVWVKRVFQDAISDRYLVTDAVFTYVAIDENGKPSPVPRENNPELAQALKLIAEYESKE